MKQPILLLVACLWLGAAHAQDSIHFRSLPLDHILKESKKTGKPVMLYFTGTGCALCKEMEKKVFTDPAVYSLYNNRFINVELFDDFYHPDSAIKKLQGQYGVISNPTFIYIDGDGKLIHKTRYNEAATFNQVAQQALSGDNYAYWLKQMQAGSTDPQLLIKYLQAETPVRMYVETDFDCPAQKVLDAYFAAIPASQLTDSTNWYLIEHYVYNPRSAVFQYLLDHQPEFYQYGKDIVDKKIFQVLTTYLTGNTDSDRYKRAVQEVQQMPYIQAKVLMRFREVGATVWSSDEGLSNAGRCHDFIVLGDSLFSNYTSWLNIFQVTLWVQTICEKDNDTADLAKTCHWMEQVVAGPTRDYFYYEVYARNLFLVNRNREAVAMQQKAIALAVADQADEEELEGLRARLTEYTAR